MKKKFPDNKYKIIASLNVIFILILWYLLSEVFHVFRNGMLPGPNKIFETFILKLTSKTPDGNTLLFHIKT